MTGGPIRVAALIVAIFTIRIASVHADPASPGAWPAFRGPSSNGHAQTQDSDVPLTWSESSNVTWKTAIPHEGWSTPVVMDGRVWLTTAATSGTDSYVLALDAGTGEILFNRRLFHTDDPEPLNNNVNGYASPSPTIEAGRVFVHFGSYGTACIDTDSYEVLWKRTDLRCRHFRGPGSSLLLFEDILFLTFDGVDVQYVMALDKRTGETIWRADRTTVWHDLDEHGQAKRQGDLHKAFSTPVIARVDGSPQLLSVGSSTMFSYDPYTGREIWKLINPGHTPSTQPVLKDDVAFIMTGYDVTELRAVRLGGLGDITQTHLKWSITGSQLPDTPSPIIVDDLLYIISNRGIISCLETDTGAEVWSERVGGNIIASPVYAGGHLYFSSTQGKTTVLAPGRAYKHVATNELDSGFMASPAVAGNALYLRTKTHLYRIDVDGPVRVDEASRSGA